jgi:hypothetical protein
VHQLCLEAQALCQAQQRWSLPHRHLLLGHEHCLADMEAMASLQLMDPTHPCRGRTIEALDLTR